MKNLKGIMLTLSLLILVSATRAQDATTSVNNVLKAYLSLKNALVADNSAVAKSEAKMLLTAVTAVPADKLTPAQKVIWTNYTDKLQFDSRHISESDAIDHQREHFTSLSKNMYEVMKGLKLNTTIVYEQYCPMKRATWLSETAAIKNPYFGKEMLSCGKTTATLAATIK